MINANKKLLGNFENNARLLFFTYLIEINIFSTIAATILCDVIDKVTFIAPLLYLWSLKIL